MICAFIFLLSQPATAQDWQAMSSWDQAFLESQSSATTSWSLNLYNVPTGAVPRARTGMSVAMFAAGNAVELKYKPYFEDLDPPTGVSSDQLSAAAGHAFIRAAYPEAPAPDALLSQALIGLDDETRRATIDFTEDVAKKTLARAIATKGPLQPVEFDPKPGYYQPTQLAVGFEKGTNQVRWTIGDAEPFFPEGPPALDSEQYARDLAEVKAIGAVDSQIRTPAQTRDADFWFALDYQPMVSEVLAGRDLGLFEEARIHALVNVAMDDSSSVHIEAKRHFMFWRPIVAIRRADLDGLPETKPDIAWRPYLFTPGHPEYPCGHCQAGAAAATVLTALVPIEDGQPLSVFNYRNPENRLPISDFGEFQERMSMARIWGGVHYRFSKDDAEKLGTDVALSVMAEFAAPLAE